MIRTAPRPVGRALDAFVDGLAPPTALAAAQRAWDGAVGEAVAAAAKPVSESGGVLTIACESSVWAQELDLLAPELLERLAAALGGPSITRLRCVCGGRR